MFSLIGLCARREEGSEREGPTEMNQKQKNDLFTYLILALSLQLPSLAFADENRSAAGASAIVEIGARRAVERIAATARWHRAKPPMERVAWAGLAASGLLAAGVVLGRVFRLRRGRMVPRAFAGKCLDRLCAGTLDREDAVDYCELNSSPAARVALGAIRRWGRPVADVERGAALAGQVEVAALRRHVGTLRRIAGIAPMIGLLGTLSAAGRVLAASPGLKPGTIGPEAAATLGPLIAGVALAILALVAYDGLSGKVESLQADLERIIARIVDAIATADDVSSQRSRGDSAGPLHSPHQIPTSQRLSK
jgi:biopolymer transport protein ExbB